MTLFDVNLERLKETRGKKCPCNIDPNVVCPCDELFAEKPSCRCRVFEDPQVGETKNVDAVLLAFETYKKVAKHFTNNQKLSKEEYVEFFMDSVTEMDENGMQ